MNPVEITRDNWWPAVIEVRKKDPKIPVWRALAVYYNICVESIIDPLSKSIYETYMRLNGLANENFSSMMNLPAIYVAGCDCINVERSRIKQYG